MAFSFAPDNANIIASYFFLSVFDLYTTTATATTKDNVSHLHACAHRSTLVSQLQLPTLWAARRCRATLSPWSSSQLELPYQASPLPGEARRDPCQLHGNIACNRSVVLWPCQFHYPVSPLRRWFSFPQRCSHVHGPTTGLPCSPGQHGPSGCSVLPEPRPRPRTGPRHRPRRHGTDGKLQRPLWHEHSTFLRRLAGRLLRESPAIGAPELTTHAHTDTRPDQIVFVGDFLYYVLLVLFPHRVEGLTLTVNRGVWLLSLPALKWPGGFLELTPSLVTVGRSY